MAIPPRLVAVLRSFPAEARPSLRDSPWLLVNPRSYATTDGFRFEQAPLGREVALAGEGAGVPGRVWA